MAANITADMRLQSQIRVTGAETEATTWSLADTEWVTDQLERDNYGFTSNEQKRFKTELSFRLIECEARWETIGIQALWKTIEQRMIHVRYPKMHLLSHISEPFRRMGSGDDFTSDISEWLHIANLKEAYRSSNKVNYIQQRLKHNDWCTGLDYVEETLSYRALKGWYNFDSAKVFNLLSATDKLQSTRRAHLLHLQTIQDEPIIRPVSQQVYHLRETHVRRVCRRIKLTSLREASEDYGIRNFGQLFRKHIEEEDRGHKVSGLVLGYDQNVLIDSIFMKLRNGQLYYHWEKVVSLHVIYRKLYNLR